MPKYIDIDKAKETKVYSAERHEYIIPVANLDWLPPADVQEVKHGKWIPDKNREGIVICSECKRGECCSWFRDKYCSHCGAKMDLEDGK